MGVFGAVKSGTVSLGLEKPSSVSSACLRMKAREGWSLLYLDLNENGVITSVKKSSGQRQTKVENKEVVMKKILCAMLAAICTVAFSAGFPSNSEAQSKKGWGSSMELMNTGSHLFNAISELLLVGHLGCYRTAAPTH